MPFRTFSDGAVELWHGAQSYASELLTPTIRLGVTGLARSGKTVFITALIRNLVEGGRLPFFTPAAEGRILRAYLEPQPDDDVPRFGYEDHVAALVADPPLWPQSTSSVSQLRVTIEYEPQNLLRRTLGANTLHIDIVDYPGEWLIDLPLLEMSYQQWAREALALCRQNVRLKHAAPFLEFLDGLQHRSVAAADAAVAGQAVATPDAAGGDIEQIARRGAQLFTKYLSDARADDHALSIAGPGRFLMPGDLKGSPLLTFFPLDPELSAGDGGGVATATAPAPSGGTGNRSDLSRLLSRRYQSYKSHVVKPFFRDHFVRLDRQIVLVDALSAMNAGPAAVSDLRAALEKILHCFRPGKNSWLSAILYRRIDRLLFAATKADHLHHSSHDRLQAVLALLTEQASKRASASGAEVKVMALAGLRATTEIDVTQKGDVLHCIKGIALPGERLGTQVFDGKTAVAIFPGDLPQDPAQALASGPMGSALEPPLSGGEPQSVSDDLRFIKFRPPALPPATSDGAAVPWPHIRLDRALEFLLGDRLL